MKALGAISGTTQRKQNKTAKNPTTTTKLGQGFGVFCLPRPRADFRMRGRSWGRLRGTRMASRESSWRRRWGHSKLKLKNILKILCSLILSPCQLSSYTSKGLKWPVPCASALWVPGTSLCLSFLTCLLGFVTVQWDMCHELNTELVPKSIGCP